MILILGLLSMYFDVVVVELLKSRLKTFIQIGSGKWYKPKQGRIITG